jgi:hypothetical protein
LAERVALLEDRIEKLETKLSVKIHSDDIDRKSAILYSLSTGFCEAHGCGVAYKLPDGAEVDYEDLKVWLLDQGIDIEDEWDDWLDYVGNAYVHCGEEVQD